MNIDRLIAPQYTVDFNFPDITPECITLPNKVPIYIINAGSQELCKIEFVFNAGNFYEKNALIANAVNALMREGTATRTAPEIAETLDYYGAFLETAISRDKATVVLYTLNKHLAKTLPVLMDIIQHATFPAKELNLYKTNQKQCN